MRRRTLLPAALVTAAILTASFPGRANADVIGYATEVGNANLLSVDLTTATSTVIGGTGLFLVEGLALSSNGTLYATDDQGNLYTLNTTTGASHLIGSTGLGDVEGLAFNGNTLLATDYTNNATSFFALNTTTGAATGLFTTSPGIPIVHALTVTDGNTGLVLSSSNTTESLVSVNLTTGASTTLGTVNPISGLSAALASSAGTLYALDSLGYAYTVSPSGNFTEIGFTGSHFYLDLTLAPSAVPEPSTFLLCGVAGVFGLGVIRLRRERAA